VPRKKKKSQTKRIETERELARAGDQRMKHWESLGQKALGNKK
jgi:hypothetical protein